MAGSIRLDRFLTDMGAGTRSQVKEMARRGRIQVNGTAVKKTDVRIEPDRDVVVCDGRRVEYVGMEYYMLNKPMGVVSATRDNHTETVVDLLGTGHRADIFPVGRLDKDTEGFLLLTNDGELAHRLLAPGRHVDKVYQVKVAHPLSSQDVACLEQGVDIGEEAYTLPARVEVVDRDQILLTIQEGRFHQVKRMLQAVDNKVMALKRVSFGGLVLDPGLEPGACRELTPGEVELLQKAGSKKGMDKGKIRRTGGGQDT